MYKGHSISIVIPCLNEEEGIKQLLPTLPSFIDEILVVDNGSTDGTAEAARSCGARVIVEQRPGYGSAYKAGIPNATGEIVVTMDGDGSYPATEIERVLEPIIAGTADFISGSRFPLKQKVAMDMLNQIGNYALTLCANMLFMKRLKDSQSGMWAFPKTHYAAITPESDGMAFSQELKLQAILTGLRFQEVAITYVPRIGVTKLSWFKDGVQNLRSLFKTRLWSLKKANDSRATS